MPSINRLHSNSRLLICEADSEQLFALLSTHLVRLTVFLTILLLVSFLHAQVHTTHQPLPADHRSSSYAESPQPPGIVVEAVDRNSGGERAGIQPGDVLQRWTRGDVRGDLNSPFDLIHVQFDQMSLGTVRIEGVRGEKRKIWFLRPDSWGIGTRPQLSDALLAVYHQTREAGEKDERAKAIQILESAIANSQSESASIMTWLFACYAEQLAKVQKLDEANDAYRLAVTKANEIGPEISAEVLWAWGSLLEDHDDLVGAERCYLETLIQRRKIDPNSMSAATALLNLGVVRIKQGNLAAAEDDLHLAFDLQRKLAPESTEFLNTLEDLGVLLHKKGDLAQAEYYYRWALSVETKIFPSSHDNALRLANIGELEYDRGNFKSAEHYLTKALSISHRLVPSSLEEATILSYDSQCLLMLGRIQAAVKIASRALRIRKHISPGSLAVALSLIDLGDIYKKTRQLTRAEEFYREGLSIAQKVPPPHPEVATAFESLADVLRDSGKLAEAEADYRQALRILEDVTPESDEHARTTASLAVTLRREHQDQIALQLYEQAVVEFERAAERLGGTENDIVLYRAQHHRVYTEYVDMLASEGQVAHAFEISESSRARALAGVLSAARLTIRRGTDLRLLNLERSLQFEIRAKVEQRLHLLQSQHETEAAQVDKELGDLFVRSDDVQAQIRSTSPEYAKLVHPKALTVAQVQALLDSDSLLLEYSLGDDRSYVWAVSQDSLVIRELPKRIAIENAIRAVYRLVNERGLILPGETELQRDRRRRKIDREYIDAAAQLSRMILSPVARLLEQKRLLIVADGALHYVSFAALPILREAIPEELPPLRTHLPAEISIPLIAKHEIVSLPSASILGELRAREQGRNKPFNAVAVLADPVFDEKDERVQRLPRSVIPSETVARGAQRSRSLTRSAREVRPNADHGFYLPRLFASREEAEAILAVTPVGKGMKALDFDASRTTATDPVLAQYRVVHFATHGLLNSKHPELSGLVFSLVDRSGKRQDGFLQLEDIYNLDLPVDLVVLSGCETGLGQEISGEGLIGLTRGFMYAGAQRVVASLWSVSDDATADLMERFYKAMEKDGLTAPAALRKAQVAMWKTRMWSAPYYWAAFQIQGDWR